MGSDQGKTYTTKKWYLPEGLRIFFLSEGIEKKLKLIEYTYAGQNNGISIFNLGFGDYDLEPGTLNDNVASANGDGRIVLNTVLSTIPFFFNCYPDDMLLIRGSDSNPSFKEECNRICSKKCGEKCRKFNQRIRIYRNYIDLSFEKLKTEY